MKFFETSKIYSLNKSTYVNLRWIAYIGQLSAILYVKFILKFNFSFVACILILFLSVLIYTWYSFYYSSRKNNDEDVNDKNPSNLRMLFILIISGITLLSFGANLFVKGAIDIARYFGISEIVIGMTIVALGTSLPELATSVIASFRKEHAISIGNIVGSNLFNLLSVIGIVSLVSPIESPKEILFFEIPYMIIYGLILFPIGMLKQPIHRLTAAFLLIGYLLFIYQLF